MRISVALTTFEPDLGYLEQQVRSIGMQDRPVDEVVWSDDGSVAVDAREIAAIVRSVGVDVVDLSESANVGLRKNWERVLTAGSGDVIVLSDQDDVWAPGKVAAIEAAFSLEDVALWFSDADIVSSDNSVLGGSVFEVVGLSTAAIASINDVAGIALLQYGTTVTGATMAVSKSALEAALPLPSDLDGSDYLYLHDGWISIFAALTGQVAVDSRILTHYRQHAGQFTAMAFQQMLGGQAAARQLSEGPEQHLLLDHRRAALLADRVRLAGLEDSAGGAYLVDRESFLGRRASLAPRQIGRALASGQYRRHGRGLATAAKDVARLASRRLGGAAN